MVTVCPNCGKTLSAPYRKKKSKFFYIEFFACDGCGLRFEIVVHLDSPFFKLEGVDKKDLALFERCVRKPAEQVPTVTQLGDALICVMSD